MKKLRRFSAGLFAMLMLVTMLAGSFVNVYAEDTDPPPDSAVSTEPAPLADTATEGGDSTVPTEEPPPESVSPAGDSSADSIPANPSQADPLPSDTSSSLPEDSSSLPADSSSLPEDPSSLPEDSTSLPEEDPSSSEPLDEEPAREEFVPLEIVDFTANPQGFTGADVELAVGLNRDDVDVSYQWQMYKPPVEEETELIYDYADGVDTSYYFPYFDITEAELLAMNPDATWPGIEMYLAALEEAGGDASAVAIENGTPNTIVEGEEAVEENSDEVAPEDDALPVGEIAPEAQAMVLEEPVWEDIEGATGDTYTFTLDEENASNTYRVVITIVDEEYLALAAENVEDAYGLAADPENADSSVPAADSSSAPTSETETGEPATDSNDESEATVAEDSEEDEEDSSTEEAVVEEIDLAPESVLYSDVATVSLLSIMPMAAPHAIDSVQQSGPWIIGLDPKMEYITADTYNANPDAANANNQLWTYLGSGAENRFRPDGTPYLQAGLTNDGKLPILSAWYGKTVYFRYHEDDHTTMKAIDIPAYTGIDYTNGMKTLYKDAVSVLSVFVPETGPDYYNSFLTGIQKADSTLSGAEGTSIKVTSIMMTPKGGKYAGISFNENAAAYLKDAEGNYRYDSVMAGVNVDVEPDLSGAAAWALRDYIEEGYGFITGHDMMYGYGGVNPNPNYVPDPNSTATPYYKFNTRIDGHWNMNWLMGTNKHYTDASPYEAASMVLCFGDYRDKSTLYGEHDEQIYSTVQIKTHTGAPDSVLNRTPTNYPFNSTVNGHSFSTGTNFRSYATHSNQQIAYGTVWMEFASNSLQNYGSGRLVEDQRADGLFGTNNFYLTTNGNIALNQIGHIIRILGEDLETSYNESRILANTIMHVSQRAQCQICQSGQNGNTDVHFTHRIYDAADLAKIGDERYWYTFPANGCYTLAANITLPDDWTPIENFTGHFHADNYGSVGGHLTNHRVTLGSNGKPVFANNNWNLGTDPAQGTPGISGADSSRTTGIARVSGQLHLLLGGQPQDWANHIVVVKGSDDVDYWARTNIDGKYVISNIPCTGIMEARVYKTGTYTPNMDATGTGIPQNGTLRVNVPEDFWSTSDTTAIYIKKGGAFPIKDASVYDGEDAMMVNGGVLYESKVTDVTWQVRLAGSTNWVAIASSGLKYDVVAPVFHADGENSWTEVALRIKDACILNSGLNVRAVFKTPDGATYDTYSVGVAGSMGKLTVEHWPMRVVNPKSVEVWADATSTFTSSVEAKGGRNNGLSVQWQIRRWDTDTWVNVENYAVLNNGVTKTQVTTDNGVTTGDAKYPVRTTTTLKILNTPDAVNGMYVRAVYTYTGAHTTHPGSTIATGNKAAMITVKQPKLGVEWVSGQAGRIGMSFENPLLCDAGNPYASGSAVYEADIVYLPGAQDTSEGSPSYDVKWRFKTTTDPLPIELTTQTLQNLANRLAVNAPTWRVETGAPVRGADGIYRIHTKLTVSNVHWKFYSDDCFVSFSAQANTHYKTDPYKTITAETTRMPLVVDYKVSVKWNGGDFERIPGQPYTTWTYPNATVDSVADVKTLLIEFDTTTGSPIHPNTRLDLEGAPLGMWPSFVGAQYALYVSDAGAKAQDVERFLRNKVKIYSYDTQSNPKVWVYINAEKNLGNSLGRSAVSTFLEGFDALEGDVGIAPLYAQNVQIEWSAAQLSAGGSIVAHSNATNAGYYQWQLDRGNGAGWQNLAGENRPTLALSSLDGSMNGWKFHLIVGDNAADPAKKTSNDLQLSFGFSGISIPGESYIEGWGANWFDYGSPINIPSTYAPYVTRISYQYEVRVNSSTVGDVFYGAYGIPTGEEFQWSQLFGNYARNTVDRTLTSGQGLTGIRARAGNNATSVAYNASMRVWDVKIWGVGDLNAGGGYVIQRGPHEAWDITTVFHDPTLDPDVVAVATSQSKVYDGVESMAAIQLIDRKGVLTDGELAQILARGTVTYSNGVTIAGNRTSGSLCIDVGVYSATFKPNGNDALFFSYNNPADIAGRTTRFEITKRPLYLYSNNNDKEYDGTDATTVKNVLFRAYSSTGASGVVPSDAGRVAVSPTSFAGNFNGVINQTNGRQIPISRNENVTISLSGARSHNYMIAGEEYTGAITPRKLNIHSLYMDPGDPPNNPRNIKQYDGTTYATIGDIIIERIITGDTVWIDKSEYAGRYATANAGERLNPDGTTKGEDERYTSLDENVITRTGAISLINNLHGNYVIGSEKYSGAIYRRTIDARVVNQSTIYGEAYTPNYRTAPVYSASETGQDNYELIVDAMVASDTLTIDNSLSWFVFDREITETTPAGEYAVKYVGLNETNYGVLSNYVIIPRNGAIVVQPRELVIRVAGGFEKIYGDPNPEFGIDDVSFEYFVNGDTVETALTGELQFYTRCKVDSPVRYNTDNDIVGYGVTAYGLECKVNENGYYNYDIRYESGDIKVLRAPLTITADDKTRPQRTDNPEWTATYTGFKVGDGPEDLDVMPTLTCEADFYSPVGDYPIVVSGAQGSNYDITEVNGTLTIYDGASIDIRKSADKSEVEQDGTITYTIRVENNGERPLYEILIEDFMSEIAGEIKAIESDKYEYIGDGQFTIDFMAIGDVVEIQFTYTTNQFDPGDTTITNSAKATESLTDPTDDNPDEWFTDEVGVYIIVNRDIDYDKKADVKFAQAGDTITYTHTVTNTGNVPLPGITIEDEMTPHESTVQVMSSPDYSTWKDPDRERRIFTLRTIQPGETITITYTFTVSAADANKKMVIQNFATTTVPEDDRYPGEPEFIRKDEEDVFLGLDEVPMFAVKTADRVYANVGDTITYTMVYTNTSNATLPSIVVQDKSVPKRGSIVILPGEGYTFNQNNGHITFEPLAPGATLTLTFQYTVSEQDTRGHNQIYDSIEHNGNLGVLSNNCYVAIG